MNNRKEAETGGNQGEGNRTADRRYRKNTQEFIEKGRVPDAAEEARDAIHGSEASELERAEREAKARRKSDDV